MFSARIVTNGSTNVKTSHMTSTLVIIHFKGFRNVYALFFQGENSPVKVFGLQLASYVLVSSI